MSESVDPESLCHICQHLHQPKEDFEPVDFGTLEQLYSRRTCPVCRLVVGLLPNRATARYSARQQIGDDDRWQQNVKLQKMARNAFVVWLHETNQGELGYFFLSEHIKVHPIWGFDLADKTLRTTRNTVDYAGLKHWIAECDSDHPECTKTHALRGNSLPVDTWLIDTLDNCLVLKTTETRYLVLSYVRGNSVMFQATRSNHEQLQKPGALQRMQNLLNPIVGDAIKLTSLLGVRYLWIDALCILQDDMEEKARLIMQMDAIYAHAFLTIVALSAENAESRLPGVEMDTLRINAASVDVQTVFADDELPNQYCAVGPSLIDLLRTCAYNSRGWTFQESMLSKRCLIFTDHRIFYHCSSGLQSESKMLGNSDVWPNRSILPSAVLDVDGQFGLYTRLVHDFSKRKLTYPEDSLKAIRGVFSILSNNYQWRFIAGLPSHLLHHALLWRSASSHHLRNRAFPSWSWAGWIGCANWNMQSLMDPLWTGDDHGNASYTPLLFETEAVTMEAVGPLDSVESQDPDQKGGIVLRLSSDIVQSNIFKMSSMRSTPLDRQSRSGMSYVPLTSFNEIWTAGDLRCGIIYDFQGDMDESHHFVALSRSKWSEEQHKHSGRYYGDDFISWQGHIYDDKKLAFSEYCIVNVMLVEAKEWGTERVGIGWIHYDVWKTVDKTWRPMELL
jgi:hypothetical protein